MTKRSLLITILIFAFLTMSMILPVMAEQGITVSNNTETGYSAIIADEAELLTNEEEEQLMQEMERATKYATVVFVTSNAFHSGSSESYAKTRMEEICRSEDKDGYTSVVFLIDMSERTLAIYSGETVFKTINTGLANSITDNVYRYASKGDYLGCAESAFSQITRVLEGQGIAQPMRIISAALLAMFTGLAAALIMVRSKTRKLSKKEKAAADRLVIKQFAPQVTSTLVSTRKVPHVEVHTGGGGGGHSGGGFSGGGFSGGGFSGGGGGGFSGSGGGGSHKF